MHYEDTLTLGEARDRFFAVSGFTAASYFEPFNKVKVGPLPLVIPNPYMRQRALPLHDLHHILTGYPTDLRGESQICAWEIGSGGLGRYPIGWPYVLFGVVLGLLFWPRELVAAYRRGRQSRNLFNTEFSDRLLSKTVGELRQELKIA
ncbi:MAG TPA: Coq4 family protein [Bdellovibrionales bacterium]|nr:Coq4 family protein [Bdellovibrionales bacterium]